MNDKDSTTRLTRMALRIKPLMKNTEHNNTQHNDSQRNCDIQHKISVVQTDTHFSVLLNVVVLTYMT